MSKYYTTKYVETETIFRCYTGDILRFYEASCGDFLIESYIDFTVELIEIIWKIGSSELSSFSLLQDALKGGDSQRGFPML